MQEIPPKIQYIKKISEAYQYFIKHGFFKAYDEFSCAINTLENYQSLPIRSSSRSLTLKFLKPGKNILAYAEKCKYPSPASLENYSSAEFFQEITQIISELRNTRQYSQYLIEKKINQLFSSQTLQENRGDQTIQFFYRDPRFFMVQIRTKSRMDWLESILFSNFLSIFDFANNYQILLSVDYWRIFIRFLTLTPIEWIEFLPGSVIPTPTHELIYFYNYTSQKWDFHKFSLSENCNQITSLVKKYLPSKSRTSPFYPVYDEKVAKLFLPFSLPKFMQGVFILRKDNEIAKKLLKSPSPYFDFLHHTFLVPLLDVDSTKKFLRENYTLTFAQIKRILRILPKQQSKPSSDLELGKYLLIIQDYLFPCHPRVLSQDRLLTGLFCPGLQQAFFFGGVKEGVLVLEYIFPQSIVSSPEFKLQELLNKIEKKYLLKLRLLKIIEEYRFISTEYLTSASLEVKQYQHVNVNKTDGRISHPSFVHISQNMHYLRASKHIPDAFWQVVGHPVTLFVHITCSASMTIPLVNMLMQLPIGQILVSEEVSPSFDVELVAWIHLAETIDEAMYQLIQILEEEKVRYFISPIIDYSIISDPNLKLPIKLKNNSSF